ncbi:MAG: CPBP family intramembrane metalloprotease [bacterium]|nr:CPBP family intramembrane metalloprotease [bacterium]
MTQEQKIWLGARTIWNSAKPLLLYLFFPGLFMSVGMLVRAYRGTTEEFINESSNFYTCLSVLVLGFWLHRRAKKRGSSLFEEATLFWEHPDRRYAALCLALGAAAGLFLSAALSILPLPEWMLRSYSQKSASIFAKGDLPLVCITVGFLSPLMEEIIFRGYMLNRLLTFFSKKQAVFVTSLLFALCHANFIWMLYAFGMGQLLGWISIRRDNILYAVCLHIGFNLPSVVIAVLSSFSGIQSRFLEHKGLIVCYGLAAAFALQKLIKEMKREEG